MVIWNARLLLYNKLYISADTEHSKLSVTVFYCRYGDLLEQYLLLKKVLHNFYYINRFPEILQTARKINNIYW